MAMDGTATEVQEGGWAPYPGALCLLGSQRALLTEPPLADEAHMKGESRAARVLARRAMQLLDASRYRLASIPRSPGGPPQWPQGWVGSLAHDHEYAAALVGPDSHFLGLGVDLEPLAPLPEDAARLVLDPGEQSEMARLPGGYARWSRVVFGAKECLHKCVHPRRGSWLEFDEVAVRIDAQALSFQLLPKSDSAAAALEGVSAGRICFMGGRVLTALAWRLRPLPRE